MDERHDAGAARRATWRRAVEQRRTDPRQRRHRVAARRRRSDALSGAIPAGERIVTIEDAAELRLRQPHVVRLEARPPNVEGQGRGDDPAARAERAADAARPDRRGRGEGAEALDMLMALNTGHDGSLSTVHANSPEEALRRIEVLALMAGVGLPHAAVRDAGGRRVRPRRAPGAAARRRAPRHVGGRGRPRRGRRRDARAVRAASGRPSGARLRGRAALGSGRGGVSLARLARSCSAALGARVAASSAAAVGRDR